MEQELNKAYAFYKIKQYDSSLVYFDALRKQVSKTDTIFGDVAFGYAASLYFQELAAKNREDWDGTSRYASAFLSELQENGALVGGGLMEKKYFAIKDLVVANFGMDKKEVAKKYQELLYEAYQKKHLPEGIDKYYNFQKFTWKRLNIWAYEWYPNLGDKETEGSFSKQVYYIYSRDEYGADKEQLCRLHTIKIHKLSPDNPKADYVLTFKRKTEQGEASRTLWEYTFFNPVDYNELNKAVMAFLEKNEQQIMQLLK